MSEDKLSSATVEPTKGAENTAGEPNPDDPFCLHEALHMTSFLCHSVGGELSEHVSIKARPDWLELARRAEDALADLYQKIGAVDYGG